VWHGAVTPANVASRFQKAGIYPYNRDAISCNKETEKNQQNGSTVCPENVDSD